MTLSRRIHHSNRQIVGLAVVVFAVSRLKPKDKVTKVSELARSYKKTRMAFRAPA